jgi:peptidoglycan/xylan/chitin deacetylase (PgdA/CDA1 family)
MAQVGVIFHGIGEPARALEPGEAPYWISQDLFRRILDKVAADPEPKRICLSFDDGNVSDHDVGLPELQARGLRADFFVLAGRIGQTGSLDVPRIRALQAAGMTIGSHGMAHRDWRRLEENELYAELVQSRAMLEEICGQPVTTAGIPFGGYNARVLRALRAAGYTCAWSSDRGTISPGAFLRPRTSVQGAMDQPEIADILAGRMPLAVRARRALGMARRRWL